MEPYYDLPLRHCGKGLDLLKDVKVIDLTTSIAGPFSTQMLADMGADVLKVERIGVGDDTRHWGPPNLAEQSLWFLSANRNKQSLALNYADERGRELLHGLIAEADVVVLNSLPRVQKKLGVDYETLSRINPSLIFCSITGFGLTGERADWACYDLIAEGYSGIMDLTGELDGGPQKVGAPAADMLAAMDAAFAINAALYDRRVTGRGHRLDISLVESMTRFLAPRIMSYLGSGELPRRSGGKDSVIAIYQSFETADEPITLGLGNDNIWKRFWRAVGQEERGLGPETATNAGRRARRAELVSEIQDLLRERPREEWLQLFRSSGVPAGPINRLDQVVRDEHLRERGLFYQVSQGEQAIPQVGAGLQVDGRTDTVRSLPPRLGEHTLEVLTQRLKLNPSEINTLLAGRIVEAS
ncbi:CaiB/BaiF CoA transferase family protein [Halomonas sp. HK25]|uniref:CaiB/BaiF CoA transferase family protein n=1 Tax=Halomonas sp. HK25 TaxID=3394321 RepID=UPI0039FC18C2